MPSSNDHTVAEVADHYVERHARLDPVSATMEGIAGHDTEMTDFSPDAVEERVELDRTTLRDARGDHPGVRAGARRGRDDGRPPGDQLRAVRPG